jgi:hypothetical protein
MSNMTYLSGVINSAFLCGWPDVAESGVSLSICPIKHMNERPVMRPVRLYVRISSVFDRGGGHRSRVVLTGFGEGRRPVCHGTRLTNVAGNLCPHKSSQGSVISMTTTSFVVEKILQPRLIRARLIESLRWMMMKCGWQRRCRFHEAMVLLREALLK